MNDEVRRLDVQAVIDGNANEAGYVRWFADEVKRRADAALQVLSDIANLREPFDDSLYARAKLANAELLALGSAVDRVWEGRFKNIGYRAWQADVVDYVWGQATIGAGHFVLVESWFEPSSVPAAPDGM